MSSKETAHDAYYHTIGLYERVRQAYRLQRYDRVKSLINEAEQYGMEFPFMLVPFLESLIDPNERIRDVAQAMQKATNAHPRKQIDTLPEKTPYALREKNLFLTQPWWGF